VTTVVVDLPQRDDCRGVTPLKLPSRVTTAVVNPPQRGGGLPQQGGLDPTLGMELIRNVKDRYGNPRLGRARGWLLDEVSQANIPVITEAFKVWRDHAEFALVKGVHRETGEEIRLGIKCSKRGNDVFSYRLNQKMGFLKGFEGIELFHLEDFEKNPYMPSNLLWVTLTFNPHMCSLKEAWERIGYYWNLWITNMRNKYGRIFYLETPEAFPNPEGSAYGYPHIHTVLLFEDHKFKAFPSWEKMKDGSEGWAFRILEREEIKRQGKWMAHVDIKAIQSGRALGGYLRKHMKNTHGGDDQAALTTQALLWIHRKKTYTMSKGFRQKFHESIAGKNNSKTSMMMQGTFDEADEDWSDVAKIWDWTFHGIRNFRDLDVDPEVWVHSISKKLFREMKTRA